MIHDLKMMKMKRRGKVNQPAMQLQMGTREVDSPNKIATSSPVQKHVKSVKTMFFQALLLDTGPNLSLDAKQSRKSQLSCCLAPGGILAAGPKKR